jgi:hypothetical protein
MGWNAKDGKPIKINGVFFILCAILHFVVASTAEAKLGALFLNCIESMIFILDDTQGLRPPSTKYTGTLQQWHRRWNRKEHLDGNAIFLGV